VPRPSIPQYFSCGWPMNLDYVPCIEEFPSGGKAVCQRMDSQYQEGHWDEKNMLTHEQQE
jgi:hypothetical protein